MADAGLPVPLAPPVLQAPQVPQVPQQTLQPIQQPVSDQPTPTQQIQNIPQLNWSHFKPEFSGKPDKDVEVHLLRTNDWMDTCAFLERVKVQCFALYW